MKKRVFLAHWIGLLSFTIVTAAVLISCSSSTESGTETERVTISGVLNLPAAASGKNWVVMIDNDTDGDNSTVSMGIGVCGSGTTVNYQVQNVPVGTYYIYAVVFIVSDGEAGPQSGDYLGIYGGSFPLDIPTEPNATVSASSSEFDIDLIIIPDLFI